MKDVTTWDEAVALLSPAIRAQIRRDEPMSRHTTLRVGGPADYYLYAGENAVFAETAALAQRFSLPHFILGEGSNICVADAGVRGLVLHNGCRQACIGPVTRADAGHNFMALFVKTMQA